MEKPRALVVDDDDPIRALLVNLVEHLDFAVDSARDGAEAIERLDDDGYDVVLLDLMMPRVDGWAVLDHMTLADPDRLRHTIVASAVPLVEIAKRMNAPVFTVHPKPFDINQLIADIRAAAVN
ncbi:MAG TPA: response regulator [Thermoanaerobaculia bacterium]|jgi:CheY-like chemotaxis protein|nr:response regulator [Thermoanaerobaculia bacterium]